MKSDQMCRTTIACFTRNTKRFTRFLWNTKRFTGNIKLFTGNDSRLTRTVNRLQETILALVAPFVGVLLRFNVCKYPDYLVVFGTSPYIRFLFFWVFLFRLNPVLSLIRCELVAPTEPSIKLAENKNKSKKRY